MDAKTLNAVGLILNFLAAIILLIHARKTVGAETQADQDYVASPWWPRVGYGLLAAGFLLQIIGAVSG